MREAGATIERILGHEATSQVPLLYVKDCGTFNMILQLIISLDGNVYPVMARLQEQLVQFAKELRTELRITQVFATMHSTFEADHNSTILIVDCKCN